MSDRDRVHVSGVGEGDDHIKDHGLYHSVWSTPTTVNLPESTTETNYSQEEGNAHSLPVNPYTLSLLCNPDDVE